MIESGTFPMASAPMATTKMVRTPISSRAARGNNKALSVNSKTFAAICESGTSPTENAQMGSPQRVICSSLSWNAVIRPTGRNAHSTMSVSLKSRRRQPRLSFSRHNRRLIIQPLAAHQPCQKRLRARLRFLEGFEIRSNEGANQPQMRCVYFVFWVCT